MSFEDFQITKRPENTNQELKADAVDPFADFRMGASQDRAHNLKIAASYPPNLDFTHNGNPVVMSNGGFPIVVPKQKKS